MEEHLPEHHERLVGLLNLQEHLHWSGEAGVTAQSGQSHHRIQLIDPQAVE